MKPHNQVHSKLLHWYNRNKRSLPWRQDTSPYKVWLSEIILQQTRVDQGLPYFEKFSANYPSVWDLANANIDQILKDWQGLGYYSRARNMHKCAIKITREYKGEFPNDLSQLQKLPGIGPYTAAAIASICFDIAVPVVDGNVYRVLSRFYANSTPINTTQGKKEFQLLAEDIMNREEPGSHNQAMMELGATICTPHNPKCDSCPIQFNCVGFEKNSMTEFPKKEGRTKQRRRYFNYLVLGGNSYAIRQRQFKDVWQFLYDFPLVETASRVNSWENIVNRFQKELGLKSDDSIVLNDVTTIKHILSHQIIFATFWRIQSNSVTFDEDCNIFEADLQDIQERYAIPILIKNYLSELNE